MELDKHYKVRVNPEQSRKIQELLFALGGCWLSGSHFKEPIMLGADYLFLNKSMVLTCASEHGDCYFENKHTHTEIQAGELIAKLEQLTKNDKTMKLDDFLKCKKVKCVEAHYNSLTVGKEYSVLNIRIGVEVIDDAGSKYYWRANQFEPVLDSAENPLQGTKLTPEFEVGNKVYFGFNKNIQEIEKFCDLWDGIYAKSKSGNVCPLTTCCHATQENYERL